MLNGLLRALVIANAMDTYVCSYLTVRVRARWRYAERDTSELWWRRRKGENSIFHGKFGGFRDSNCGFEMPGRAAVELEQNNCTFAGRTGFTWGRTGFFTKLEDFVLTFTIYPWITMYTYSQDHKWWVCANNGTSFDYRTALTSLGDGFQRIKSQIDRRCLLSNGKYKSASG